MFGYSVESDFDLAKEQKRQRVGWVVGGGTAFCIIYLLAGGRFATEVFQCWLATSLFFGINFYAELKGDIRKAAPWKAIIVSVPLHVLYLAGIVWSDRAFPQAATKAVVFIPALTGGLILETMVITPLLSSVQNRPT